MTKRAYLFLLFAIFFFWLALAKNNYFHWDEWGFFTQFQNGYWPTVLGWGNEHFIPINILHHFLLFKFFGLNYLPFQISVTFFHTLNSFLLYLICKSKTKNIILALSVMTIYGFTSIFVENVVWSLGVSVTLASTFLFLAYYLFLVKRTWLSIFLLILSPMQHGITILAPLAFIPSLMLRVNLSAKSKKTALIYFFASIINVAVVFLVNQNKVLANTPVSLPYLLVQVPTFILTGVLVGTVGREIFPNFYFYDSVIYPAHWVRPLLLPILIVGAFVIFFLLLKKHWRLFVHYLPFIFITYIAIAPARATGGLAAAVITRYPTVALFFLLLLTAELVQKYKIGKKLLLGATAILVFTHIIANVNFQNNHWFPIVNRDRQFIIDATYLFRENIEVYDLPVKGIYPLTKLSSYWFLYPTDYQVKFTDKMPTNLKPESVRIYGRIIGVYSLKAD